MCLTLLNTFHFKQHILYTLTKWYSKPEETRGRFCYDIRSTTISCSHLNFSIVVSLFTILREVILKKNKQNFYLFNKKKYRVRDFRSLSDKHSKKTKRYVYFFIYSKCWINLGSQALLRAVLVASVLLFIPKQYNFDYKYIQLFNTKKTTSFTFQILCDKFPSLSILLAIVWWGKLCLEISPFI